MASLSQTASSIRGSIFADLMPSIEAHARGGGDLIELHIGDTHCRPPQAARFATVDGAELDAALYRYGAVGGLPELKQAVASRLACAGVGPSGVTANRVLVGAGATHAIFCALRAMLDPGDEVLVVAPYWPLTVGLVRAAGGVPVEVPLTTHLYEDPSLDIVEALEARRTARTRALYLTTPNNPDGKVFAPAQLEDIARWAIARDLWVLSDEVYADYVYDGIHTSMARVAGMAERTVSAYSMSKSFALAGARVGFVVGGESVIAAAQRVSTHTVFHVPLASQRVAIAALAEPTNWVDRTRSEYRAARDEALGALAGSRVVASVPQGGSYIFLDFRPVLRGRPLSGLLERAIGHGVLLAPGDGCGAAFAEWARLCFTAVPRPRLLEGIARLRAAIEH